MVLDIHTVAFVFSLNSFISFFFKKSSVFLTTSQFCFKTITIVKKILCLLTLIICTAAKRKLVAAVFSVVFMFLSVASQQRIKTLFCICGSG